MRARSRRSPGCSPATPTRRRSARCSTDGGRATTVIDGWISVLDPGSRRRPAGRGRRRPDDAGRAVPLQRRERARPPPRPPWPSGIAARARSSRGCASFLPDPEHNPGRMNFFSLRRRHRGDRPRAQRGRPRGAARDHERAYAARARGCCSASAPSGTGTDDLVEQRSGEIGARDATSW